MTVSAHIRNYDVVNKNTVHVVASLNFASESSGTEIRAALQKATNAKMTPIEGTVVLREKGKTRQTVSAFMTLASEVKPIPENKSVEEMTGFRAMSSNMFLDDNENLWELKSEGGRNLVRTHVENNMEEIQELMASVSSDAFSSMSSNTNPMFEAIANERMCIEGGDYITYVSESGELESTFVIASIKDEPQNLVCLSSDGEDAIKVERKAVSLFVKGANYVKELTQPEGMASMSGAASVDSLVDYYSRVFGYNQEFLAKLTDRIKSHAFA